MMPQIAQNTAGARVGVFFFLWEGVFETFVTWEVALFKKNNSKADEVLGKSQELFGTRKITTTLKVFQLMNSTYTRKGNVY